MLDKYKAREIKQDINRVLWEVWDPIGVREIGGPRDEYSSYVNDIFEALDSGVSDDELARKLLSFVHERMELRRATLADMRPTVAALRKVVSSEAEDRT